MRRAGLSERQNLLAAVNIGWLRQAQKLLQQIGDSAYADSPQDFEPHRVGGHLRHILEFYESFLEGVASGHIDYDARRRDHALETSREVALLRISAIIRRLETESALRTDAVIWVRMEDSMDQNAPEPFLTSSIGRELQALSSHTIHHFALMAITLRAHGHVVDPDFGMAPSTLRHRAARRAAA
jgi:hypothetical protein